MQTKTNLMIASNQWARRPADERYQTLDALRQSVADRRMRSRAVEIDVDKTRVETIVVDGETELVINSSLDPVLPSHWSFGQFAGRVRAPANYLRSLPPGLVAQNLNHGLATLANEDRGAKFLTIDTGGEYGRLQAVTSPSYGRIWDADVCDAVGRIVERTGGAFYNPKDWSNKPSGLYASDHDVFIFMIDGGSIVEGPRGPMNRGFITWNSETGAKTFGLMTFIFDQVCGNHIIWGARDVNTLLIRHTGGGPTRFDNEALPTLKRYIEAPAAPMEAMVKKASEYLLPKPETKDNVPVEEWRGIHDWASRVAAFTKLEIRDGVTVAKADFGECRTLWQLVAGITASARSIEWIDSRVDLEKRAGRLLDLVDATKN